MRHNKPSISIQIKQKAIKLPPTFYITRLKCADYNVKNVAFGNIAWVEEILVFHILPWRVVCWWPSGLLSCLWCKQTVGNKSGACSFQCWTTCPTKVILHKRVIVAFAGLSSKTLLILPVLSVWKSVHHLEHSQRQRSIMMRILPSSYLDSVAKEQALSLIKNT